MVSSSVLERLMKNGLSKRRELLNNTALYPRQAKTCKSKILDIFVAILHYAVLIIFAVIILCPHYLNIETNYMRNISKQRLWKIRSVVR
jgi:hypothetical protein